MDNEEKHRQTGKGPRQPEADAGASSAEDDARQQYETFLEQAKEFDNERAESAFRVALGRILPVRLRRLRRRKLRPKKSE